MPRRGWALPFLAVALLGGTLALAPGANADVVDSTDVQLVNHDASGQPVAPFWLIGASDDGRTALVEALGDGLTPDDTNGDWDAYLVDVAGEHLTRLSTGERGGMAQALSADGSTAVWSDGDNGELKVTDVAAGTTTSLGHGQARGISADGRVVLLGVPTGQPDAFGNPTAELVVLDRATGTSTPVARRPDGSGVPLGYDVRLSRDGSTVVFTSTDRSLSPALAAGNTGAFRQRTGALELLLQSGRQVDIRGLDATGDTVAISSYGASTLVRPAGNVAIAGFPWYLTPDGRFLVYDGMPEDGYPSHLLDLGTGADRVIAPDAHGAYVSADGTAAAYLTSAGEVWFRDLTTGVSQRICCDEGTTTHGADRLLLSADGDRVLFLQSDRWGNYPGGPGDLLTWVRTDDRVRVGAVTVDESDGSAVLPVTLTQPHAEPVTLTYRPIGTWPAGDLDGTPGTVEIPAGSTAGEIRIPLVDDVEPEGTEQYRLEVRRPDGSRPDGTTTARVTILDDDGPPPLTVADTRASEGAGAMTWTLALDRPAPQEVRVDWSTIAGSATPDVDFTAAHGTALIPAGSSSVTVSAPIIDDTVDEWDPETIYLHLDRIDGARADDLTATGTILDDDPPPALTVDPVTVGEGDGHALVTFHLEGTSDRALTIPWVTYEDGSVPADRRASGADYRSSSGEVSFAPGQRTATASIDITQDAVHEPDESFLVHPYGSYYVRCCPVDARVTIADDDPVTVSVADAHVAEDAGRPMTWTVSLSAPSSAPVTVRWWTFQDTSAPSDRRAAPDKDFKPAAGSITFAPGETTKTVSSLVFDDSFFERDEWFVVQLFDPTGATIGRAKATGTINDDESARLWGLPTQLTRLLPA